ncbi:MAG: hypothetical protein PWR29_476 [Methanolobus sp.]|nr:hypothetical protein [Methanolobus sp.]MDK2833112.1 hypothetical protein [Methanolobus sp.]MDK2911519.1 hypothetical protein [Methanolobus sp.]MDN5309598.1 hypothetical protein [Methanolobus sp.]
MICLHGAIKWIINLIRIYLIKRALLCALTRSRVVRACSMLRA